MPLAIQYDRFGGTEVLRQVTVAAQAAEPGQVRVRVKAVGLNPFDVKMRSGLIPGPDPEFPLGICTDMAGVIDAVGEGAHYPDGSPIAVGDEVLGWSENYSLREQLLVPAHQVVHKPPGLSWEQAGSLMSAALTADAAIRTLTINAGDVVLVSAAAGGVGLIYSQLARRLGATVIGTASEANHDYLHTIGVIPVVYGDGLVERVRGVVAERGSGAVTAVQDNFGRDTIDAGLALGVAPDRICSIVDHRAVAELGLASPGRYRRSAATLGELAKLVTDGVLDLPVHASFPLTKVVDAFATLETRHLRGKVVVTL